MATLAPTVRTDVRLLGAAVLIVLALGLPWSGSSYEYSAGWITPGYCYMDSSGWMTCEGGTYSAGMMLGTGPLAGAQSVARVFLVVALALMLLARGRRSWLTAAAGVLVAGILIHGLGLLGGQVAALGAVILLALVARTLSPTAPDRIAQQEMTRGRHPAR